MATESSTRSSQSLRAHAAEGSRVTGVGGLAGISTKLEADFKKQMGVSSGVYSVESFDAANILLEGIKAGKTTRAADAQVR